MIEQETHVWWAALSPELLAALPDVLDPAEQERAGRFVFPEHRLRFRCARGVLRVLLGRYLACDPGGVRFDYGPQGKPGVEGLRFNVSHSGPLAVYAFTLLPDVGIDVEQRREVQGARDIARSFFSAAEQAALAAAPDPQAAFLRCWTRKEALIKALGGGLSIDLASFDVSVDEQADLLDLRGAATSAADWCLRNLDLPDDYVGALALFRPPAAHRVLTFSFEP